MKINVDDEVYYSSARIGYWWIYIIFSTRTITVKNWQDSFCSMYGHDLVIVDIMFAPRLCGEQ